MSFNRSRLYVKDSSESVEDCSREIERVTVVKFRVDNRGSDGTGCFRIEVRTDTTEFTDRT